MHGTARVCDPWEEKGSELAASTLRAGRGGMRVEVPACGLRRVPHSKWIASRAGGVPPLSPVTVWRGGRPPLSR
eukprot:7314678-Prymnesium_polylepis.2